MTRTLCGWYTKSFGERIMLAGGTPRGIAWTATCLPEYRLWPDRRYYRNYERNP
jgi:hypothetical protein